MLSKHQQITIKTLKSHGKQVGEIAGILGVHRNTVRNVLMRDEIVEQFKRKRESSFKVHHDDIEQLLDKGLTKLRAWEILKDEQKNIRTYATFVRYCNSSIRRYTPSYIVQESFPGEDAEVDFGYAGKFPLQENGKKVKVWIFVMTLTYSRNAYYCAVLDQKVETFIQCHKAAFEFFGGVPRSIKLDNLKAAVLKNNEYDLLLNNTFLKFSSYYRFIIRPCTPHEPQQKGKVESGVKYVKKNFLAGRVFSDLVDLNQQLKDWMITKANKRIHGTTKKIPDDIFIQEEKRCLLKLPQTPYIFIPSLIRKVPKNCHIHFENNYYSVPARFVGEEVEIKKQYDNILIVYYSDQGCQEIAEHKVTLGKGIFVTNPNHYSEGKVYSQKTYIRKYEEKMKAIGQYAQQYFWALIKKDNQWVGTVRKIFQLAEKYGNESIDTVLKKAFLYEIYNPKIIERILLHEFEELKPN